MYLQIVVQGVSSLWRSVFEVWSSGIWDQYLDCKYSELLVSVLSCFLYLHSKTESEGFGGSAFSVWRLWLSLRVYLSLFEFEAFQDWSLEWEVSEVVEDLCFKFFPTVFRANVQDTKSLNSEHLWPVFSCINLTSGSEVLDFFFEPPCPRVWIRGVWDCMFRVW